MKRIVLIAVVLLTVISMTSYGDIRINWRSSWGFFLHGTTTPLLDTIGMSCLVQLIDVGPNGYADDVNPLDPNFVGGDDIFVTATVFTNVSGGLLERRAIGTYGFYTNTYASYTFYGRVFQDATPAVGEWYWNSHSNITQDVAAPADQDYDYSAPLPNVTQELDRQIVPEPTTMALLGVGAVAMILRRRQRGA